MIHYYTEAIRLNPRFVEAFNNRGIARSSKGDLDGAIRDCVEALRIKSDHVNSLRLMGNIYAIKGEDIAAYFCLQKVVELEPEKSRSAFIRILIKLGMVSEAKKQEKLARRSIKKETEYNQACFESICGNSNQALELLKKGLEKNQMSREWARQDPDLENLRDDLRFKELVGE